MQRWCKARLATLKSYRKSWPAGLCLMLSGVMNAEMLNAACYEQMARCEHELVDMGLVAQQLALKKPKRGGKRWSTKKGKCACKDCAPLSCEPKRFRSARSGAAARATTARAHTTTRGAFSRSIGAALWA